MSDRTTRQAARDSQRGTWSESAVRVLRERYLMKDDTGQVIETPDELCWRVARAIASAEALNSGKTPDEIEQVAAGYAQLMLSRRFMPNSPTLANAGKGNNMQLSACFVLPVPDDLEHIFETIKHVALVQKSGGGTGMSFSRLRPKDSIVSSTKGVASGPISFMRVFDAATEGIRQGGMRRGANMGILRVDHPDIEEFIDCKLTGGITNFNISVAITDGFMDALEHDGEYDLIDPHTHEVARRVRARVIFDRIVQAAWQSGDPGLVFLDRANHSSANPIPTIEQLEATNPCVVGATWLATDAGLQRMDALFANQQAIRVATDARVPGQVEQLAVVNGGVESGVAGVVFHAAAPVFQTGHSVPVRRLVTSHGIEITATPNHRFLTTTGYRRLDELETGDELLLQSGEGAWPTGRTLPPIVLGERSESRQRAMIERGTARPPTEWSEELGEVLGYILGDGYVRRSITADVLGLAISLDDAEIKATIQARLAAWFGYHGTVTERQGHYQVQYAGTPATFFKELGVTDAKAPDKRVPASVFAAPRDAVIGFLRGLFSADGTVQLWAGNKSCTVRLATSSKELAQDVQQLLLNLGIVGSLKLRRPAMVRMLPNTQREPARYTTQAQYELIIGRANRDRFAAIVGFMQMRQQTRLTTWIAAKAKPSYAEQFITRVTAVEDAGVADVFDTTEPTTCSLILSGLITHNCGEQFLGPYDACNLGSINLGLFVLDGQIDWDGLEATTRTTTRFLDDVIDVNPYPLAEIRANVHANRRIGLGVMGWADMLFQLGIRYDSEAAIELGERVMVAVRDWSTDESRRLATERGPFPNWERSIYQHEAPLRNATRTTVAPTGTISIIAECSSGIEPIFALAFQHRVKQPDGTYRVLDFVNPLFVAALEASDVDDKDDVLAWVKAHGTLHGHPAGDHPALRAYITAHEIAPEYHIKMQAAFQKGVNNSISKCLAVGTLIPTSQGLLAVEDFSENEDPDTFVDIREQGLTVGGHRVLAHYFAGAQEAVRIRLDNGAELTGARASHRVLTPDGWRLMAELRVGDRVLGRMEAAHGPGGARLPVPDERRTNAKAVTIPERMSPELALFLGMLAADGHTTEETGAVGLTSADEAVLSEFSALCVALFGLTPRHTVDQRNPNVQYLTLNSRLLSRWIEGLLGKGAYSKVVPPAILAGDAEEKLAFLRGVSLDGYCRPHHGLYIYAGMSERLAYGIAEVARSFGLPLVRQERVKVAYNGNVAFKVVLSNELQELVACMEAHKNQPPHFATYQVLVDREAVLQTRLPTSHPYYSALNSIRQRHPQNCDDRTAKRFGWASGTLVYKVTAVAAAGTVAMYDVEVEDAHEYVVNGIVSHNTINLPHSATPADVEAAYKMAWDLGCLGITIFRDGSKGEQVLNVGVKKDAAAPTAPEPAPVVTEPAPAAPALPEPAAPSARRRAAYTQGVKDRPEIMFGYTRQVRAPEGKVNVTLNSDEDGLLEVFVTVGKAGSDVAALAEALGRLISLHLRVESPLSQNDRAQAIAEQLRAIGGSASIGFGADRVRSLPDAVARAINLHLERAPHPGPEPQTAPKPHTNGHSPATPPVQQFVAIGNLCPQCGCNTLVFEEGCKKCWSCGYSEC